MAMQLPPFTWCACNPVLLSGLHTDAGGRGMIANKYEQAVNETKSVLSEWLSLLEDGQRVDSPHTRDVLSRRLVDRLVAKGLIQSTDPDELIEPQYRTGPLKPGRTVVPTRSGSPAGPVVTP